MIIIYRLLNLINNKGYTGQTSKSLKERWQSGCGYSKCPIINNAIKKYGKNNFYYDILMIIENNDSEMEQILADYWEDYFIEKFQYLDNKYGYNLGKGGKGNTAPRTEKQKLAVSKSHKNIPSKTRKLTNIQVAQIRKSGFSLNILAKQFNVSKRAILNIKHRKTYNEKQEIEYDSDSILEIKVKDHKPEDYDCWH